jgi:hypothetical protein
MNATFAKYISSSIISSNLSAESCRRPVIHFSCTEREKNLSVQLDK